MLWELAELLGSLFAFASPATGVSGASYDAAPGALTTDEGGGKSAAGERAGGSSPGDGKGRALDEHGGLNWGGAERGRGGVKLQSWVDVQPAIVPYEAWRRARMSQRIVVHAIACSATTFSGLSSPCEKHQAEARLVWLADPSLSVCQTHHHAFHSHLHPSHHHHAVQASTRHRRRAGGLLPACELRASEFYRLLMDVKERSTCSPGRTRHCPSDQRPACPPVRAQGSHQGLPSPRPHLLCLQPRSARQQTL